MQTGARVMSGSSIGSAVIGLLVLSLAAATLAGQRLPLISGHRAATIAVAVLGFAMCTLGMGRSIESLGWLHPLNIAGSLLGVVAIALAAIAIFGWQLPGLDERTILIALAAVVVLKWALSLLRQLVWG